MEIIAHRGNNDSNSAPENSVEAIKAAWNLGVDGVEIDIHLTKDDNIAVIHDSNTEWLTSGTINVSDSTLSELKELSLLGRKNKFSADKFKIPSLEEVLITIPKGKKLFIEIKHGANSSDKLICALKTMLNKHNELKPEQIVFIGFIENSSEFAVMRQVKKDFLDYKMFPIFDIESITNTESVIDKALSLNADGIDIGSGSINTFKTLKIGLDSLSEFIRKAQSANLSVNIWGLDNREITAIYKEYGICSTTTNMPGLMGGL